MSITAVTVSGTAQFAGGEPVPNAVVSFVPDQIFSQAGTTVSVAQGAFANASGAFTITVNATDDVGTSPLNGGYYVRISDPVTGEHVEDFRAPVQHATGTSQTLATLKGNAF